MTTYAHTMKQFLKAIKKGTEFVINDLNGAAQIVGGPAWMNDGAAVEQVALNNMTFLYYPDDAFMAGIEQFSQDLFNLGLTKNTYTRDQLFDLSLLKNP
jgi:hypothetical protein